MQSWLTKFNHSMAVEPLQLGELSQTETEQLIQTLLVPEAVLISWESVHRTVMALDASREVQTAVLETHISGSISAVTDWSSGELCVLCALSGDWAQAHSYA